MVSKNAAKQDSFLQRTTKFFRGVWNELKKVHWPRRSELVTYTSVVIVSVFIVALVIWVVDSIFSTLLDLIL
ncbi:preprotein translocase subunit SecE [Calderihabitans maritimus]|uniref:Protein translocase subunit SecE n=1 Tax=Calderihabitans maritimus TaxID=1246530 RepID=A0A1Z5HRP0_9FIRM|nr:preprotein translocase subunit SecE [Calderihabitans maritimus]GAW92108.1 preprotein translocase subunit SecE [Calderihabitans maritimus]